MSTKPIVDGLQQRYSGRVRIVQVDLLTPAGRELAARYDFSVTPHFVGFDAHGNIAWKQRGTPPSASMLDQLTS